MSVQSMKTFNEAASAVQSGTYQELDAVISKGAPLPSADATNTTAFNVKLQMNGRGDNVAMFQFQDVPEDGEVDFNDRDALLRPSDFDDPTSKMWDTISENPGSVLRQVAIQMKAHAEENAEYFGSPEVANAVFMARLNGMGDMKLDIPTNLLPEFVKTYGDEEITQMVEIMDELSKNKGYEGVIEKYGVEAVETAIVNATAIHDSQNGNFANGFLKEADTLYRSFTSGTGLQNYIMSNGDKIKALSEAPPHIREYNYQITSDVGENGQFKIGVNITDPYGVPVTEMPKGMNETELLADLLAYDPEQAQEYARGVIYEMDEAGVDLADIPRTLADSGLESTNPALYKIIMEEHEKTMAQSMEGMDVDGNPTLNPIVGLPEQSHSCPSGEEPQADVAESVAESYEDGGSIKLMPDSTEMGPYTIDTGPGSDGNYELGILNLPAFVGEGAAYAGDIDFLRETSIPTSGIELAELGVNEVTSPSVSVPNFS